MATDPLEALLDLVPYVRVLDHRPGNLHLRFRLSGLAAFERAGLDELASAVPGIVNIRASLFRRALGIEYDPERIPFDLWEEILSLHDRPDRRAHVLERLRELVEQREA
jgi:hypothetical protein